MSNEIFSYGNGTYSSILHFYPLLFLDQGVYKCQVEVADIIDIQTYHLIVKGNSVIFNFSVNFLIEC